MSFPEYRGGPSETQLRFLQTLGYEGMVPRSRREASAWIGRLREGGEVPVRPTGRLTMDMGQVRALRRVGYLGPLDVSPGIGEATYDYLKRQWLSEEGTKPP